MRKVVVWGIQRQIAARWVVHSWPKAVMDLKTTRALLDRLQADSKLRRLCGFELRHALPSEATFSRAFAEFPPAS